jgi:hypothetical protein
MPKLIETKKGLTVERITGAMRCRSMPKTMETEWGLTVERIAGAVRC